MSRVLVLAEFQTFAEALACALREAPGLSVVGWTAGASGSLAAVRRHRPDVAVVDVPVRERVELVRRLKAEQPSLGLVALSACDDADLVVACAEAGVAGYVPRDASVADVAGIVRTVAAGEAACSPRIAAILVRRLAETAVAPPSTGEHHGLTPREAEILRLIDDGLSNKEIARRLYIEVATVKNHVHNILAKLRVSRRAEAAARMRRMGGDAVAFAARTPSGPRI